MATEPTPADLNDLADQLDHAATVNERLTGCPTQGSERDRAAAVHLRAYQQLLDRIGDPDLLRGTARDIYMAARGAPEAAVLTEGQADHLSRIADAIEETP